ncbi:MAG: GNAT family N-acetyltransferase [Symbiobacteriia bacterium]
MLQGSAGNAWDLIPAADQTQEAWVGAWEGARGNLFSVLSQPGCTALVAEDAGRPVAFILLAAGPDAYTGQAFGYLADIFVLPEYRRLGLSRTFQQEAERYFRSLGIHRGKLWVGAHNKAGLGSARRGGFEVEAYILSKEYPAEG